MKKVYFILLGTILSSAALAQSFNISPSATLDRNIDVGVYDLANINLEHDGSTADSIEIQWEVITNTIPSTWDYSYCDYTNCYTDPSTQTSGINSKIGPGQMAFFKVTLNADTPDNAQLKVRVYKTGDAANADTLIFNYMSFLGLSDVDLGKAVNVFPNPSNGSSVSVDHILPNSEVNIVNALGQTILNKQVSTDKFVVNNINLKRGVYFVHLKRNNKTYTTRKLIVK